MKIALFLPGWIGDTVMATPAIRILKNRFPNATFTGIGRKPLDDLLAGANLIDHFITRPPRPKKKNLLTTLKSEYQFIATLKKQNFNTAYLFPNSLHTAISAYAAKIPRRIGFQRNHRSWLLTHTIKPTSIKQPNPIINEYNRLAQFDLSEESQITNLKTELAILPEDQKQFDALTKEFSVLKKTFVVLNPGGAFGQAKHWPQRSFAKLAQKIIQETDDAVLILCGPSEKKIASHIAHLANSPRIIALSNANVPISLGLSKTIVKNAKCLITTDSGPRHFAQPFNTPVISLFGPTHIEWTETYFDKAIHLQEKLPCGPCQKRICPLKHHNCMTQLTPENVLQTFLNQNSSTPLHT